MIKITLLVVPAFSFFHEHVCTLNSRTILYAQFNSHLYFLALNEHLDDISEHSYDGALPTTSP
jgi:hypothetical protein